jgi:cytochrome c peroxidase
MNKINQLTLAIFALLALVCSLATSASAQQPRPMQISPAAAKERLGLEWFFDPALSVDFKETCAHCHNPDPKYGWSDGRKVAVGRIATASTRTGFLGIRNTKTLIDCWRLENRPCNADGRAPGLAAQCLQAVTDPLVLGMPSIDLLLQRINTNGHYRDLASMAWAPTPADVQRAAQGGDPRTAVNDPMLRDGMVAFLKTIRSDDLPADRLAAGLKVSLPDNALRGWVVFQNHCIVCHQPENGWRDFEYHNIGIDSRSRSNDTGRALISGNPVDNHKYLTPSLSEVAKHGPYMHNGSMTMDEVVTYFQFGGQFLIPGRPTNHPKGTVLRDPNIDPLVAGISYTNADALDLRAFMLLGFQGPRYPFRRNPHEKMTVAK